MIGGDTVAQPATGDASTPLLSINDPIHKSTSFKSKLKNLYIILGPVLCTIICLFVNLDCQATTSNMLGVLVWICTWWVTEAVPMAITSMSPLFLFPLFGIASSDDVAQSYMDDTVALVLGSFILALAVEDYNIHRRLALNITMLFCGEPLNPQLLLLGICGTTAFVSMWMNNTAAAMMMMSVATGILQRLPEGPTRSAEITNFCKAVALGVIYSATIGGMSTLTGTSVNLILVGMWKSYFPQADPISFSSWILFGLPLALIIFLAMWATLCLFYCRKSSGRALSVYLDKTHLKGELELLGPMAFDEKMILLVFSTLIVLWMTRSITDQIPGWGDFFQGLAGDGTVSVMMATLLFVIPSKMQPGEKLMDWKKCKKLPWDIILILGASFAIADGVQSTGLTDVLSKGFNFLKDAPYLAIAPAICVISGIITEFVSNHATATLIIPVLVQLAKTMQQHPLLLMIPGAIGAQFVFLLPTGASSNIVGFSAGHITIPDMIKAGIPLKIAGILAVSFMMPSLGALVFGTGKTL